jgi:Ca2+-binding RTX toxin-like protein
MLLARGALAVTFACTPGPDDIRGRGGDDTLSGAGGVDRVRGNWGNDSLSGGPGKILDRRERVEGNGGNDSVSGNGGRVRLIGGAGSNRSFGVVGMTP